MPFSFTDDDIRRPIVEPKLMPKGYPACFMPKNKRRGYLEKEASVTGRNGSTFCVLCRAKVTDPNDFSVILCYVPDDSNVLFRLRRYNGKHEHTNRLEKHRFYDFHIHCATERYQELGADEDAYAEPTDRYATIADALTCLLQDCAFDLPDGMQQQGRLF